MSRSEVAMLVDRACGDLRDLFPVLDFVGWIFVLRGRFWVLDCMRRNQPYTVRRTPHAVRREGWREREGRACARMPSVQSAAPRVQVRGTTHIYRTALAVRARGAAGLSLMKHAWRPAPQIPAIGHVIIGPETVGPPAQSSSHVFF